MHALSPLRVSARTQVVNEEFEDTNAGRNDFCRSNHGSRAQCKDISGLLLTDDGAGIFCNTPGADGCIHEWHCCLCEQVSAHTYFEVKGAGAGLSGRLTSFKVSARIPAPPRQGADESPSCCVGSHADACARWRLQADLTDLDAVQTAMCDYTACMYTYFGADYDYRRRSLLEHPDPTTGYHMQLGTFPMHVAITGHGQINLDRAMMFEGGNTMLHVSDDLELSTNENYFFTIDVSAPAEGPFMRVTLVWTDPPASPTTGHDAALVNDLDLEVTLPDGSTVVGNGLYQLPQHVLDFQGRDRVNNVEVVHVETAGSGTFTIQVAGKHVPQGPQKFALVVNYADQRAASCAQGVPGTMAQQQVLSPPPSSVWPAHTPPPPPQPPLTSSPTGSPPETSTPSSLPAASSATPTASPDVSTPSPQMLPPAAASPTPTTQDSPPPAAASPTQPPPPLSTTQSSTTRTLPRILLAVLSVCVCLY